MQKNNKGTGKKVVSIITAFILLGLILFILLPPASSVNLTTGYPFTNSEIIFGNQITFENVNLTISGDERIPITELNFSIYNESEYLLDSVVFNVNGTEISGSTDVFTVTRTSIIQSSWYNEGYGYGYDEPEGPGFDFGYDYGYGYNSPTASDITVLYDITYNITQSGTYYAQFFVNSTTTTESHLFDSEESAHFIFEDCTLYKGWNLITMPAQTIINASHLASNISGCEMVSWFDVGNQSYKTYVNGSSAYDFQLISGYGLFVYVNQNLSLNVSGAEITNVSVPLNSTSEGWNMIGWVNSTNTNSDSIQSTITGCTNVSWYDTVNETFRTDIYGSLVYDFVIERGLGFFVQVNQSSNWYGQG